MIPVFRPSMGPEECDAVAEVLKSGWLGLGPKTKLFETRFAQYIGTRYAVAVNSATAALHLALKVSELEGREVITSPMTFVSTNHAILYNNATPVFCDIEPDTLNIDADKIEALITPNTAAILVVHYGGHAVDMNKVLQIAQEHNLKVIEDAAHACGGEYEGKKLGGLGDFGCFSFHAVKNLATGDGGMVTTNDPSAYERLRKLRWLGITRDTWSRTDAALASYSWYYTVDELGFKCHMNDIAAAIGLVQLDKLGRMNARRRHLAAHYTRCLQGISGLETPVTKPYATEHASHNYVIKCDARDSLHDYLKENGISTSVHYIPSNHYDIYNRYRGPTPVSDLVWRRVLTLPLYPDLQECEVSQIAEMITNCLNTLGAPRLPGQHIVPV